MSYFPMFVNLKNQKCLVVGGGRVALRKVETLRDFGALVTVAAPGILPELLDMEGVRSLQREFEVSDLEGTVLVVAATGDARLNHRIAEECRRRGIPVNAVDQVEDCSFIFPAYLKQGEVVAAFSSGGKSPVIAQYLKKETRPLMTERLGELAELLGSIREEVKAAVPTEGQRKQVYRALLEQFLEAEALPDDGLREWKSLCGNGKD